MPERYVLRHAWVRPNDPMPVEVGSIAEVDCYAFRTEEIGLDLYWWTVEDVDDGTS